MLGTAISLGTLARLDNPFCRTLNNLCQRPIPSSSWLDLLAMLLAPDIDLDGDGLEVMIGGADGLIAECYDGCTPPACPGPRVPPLSPRASSSCALSPRLADGYSIAIRFGAVSAQVVGIDDMH